MRIRRSNPTRDDGCSGLLLGATLLSSYLHDRDMECQVISIDAGTTTQPLDHDFRAGTTSRSSVVVITDQLSIYSNPNFLK